MSQPHENESSIIHAFVHCNISCYKKDYVINITKTRAILLVGCCVDHICFTAFSLFRSILLLISVWWLSFVFILHHLWIQKYALTL